MKLLDPGEFVTELPKRRSGLSTQQVLARCLYVPFWHLITANGVRMLLQPFAFKEARMSRILSLVAATFLAMAANAFAQGFPGTPTQANVQNPDKSAKDEKTEAKKKEAQKERRDHRKNVHHRQRRHS
jgi:hypothetical protein